MSIAGFVGASLVPLKDLTGAVTAISTGDGLVGQRLVYAHHEVDEFAVGGHAHDDELYVRAEDFARDGALTALVAYPERLVGLERYAVLVHRLAPDALDPPTDPAMTAGDLVAYSSVCTHCGTLLEWVEGGGPTGQGVDRCPLHGSEFDPYRGGAVVGGPAVEPLAQVGLAVDARGALELTTPIRRATTDA